MPRTASGPNVLLVVLDSVRAANCSLYGAARETTPRLSALASEATVYTQARAPSNWSLPSHVSLLTGLAARDHGVTVHDRLRAGHTVVEALSDRGYATGLFSENGFLTSADFGVRDCFETVEGVPEQAPQRYDTTEQNPGPDGFYYADRFLDWSATVDGPWAACVNLMDAHRPAEPRASFDRWSDEPARDLQRSLPTRYEWAFHGGDRPYWQLGGLEARYDGGIRQGDAILGRLVDRLRARGALDETLLVVCADHGDGFGEPGFLESEPPAVAHIVPMQESLLHIPLVVRRPGQERRQVVHQPAALTEFPTVVRAHVDGTPDEADFTRDVVVSTKQPVTGDLRERYERHCDNVDRFIAESNAVYVDGDGRCVRKRYHWGDAAGELAIPGSGGARFLGGVDRSRIERALPRPSATVREPQPDGIDAGTREQLASIGYY